IRLKLGLKAETPQRDAGIRIDPAVSVPRAVGTIPVATAAADPPLEPPAERSGAQGFPTWSVEPPAANSSGSVGPTNTVPGASRCSTTEAEACAMCPSRTLDEAVRGKSSTGNKSLTPQGIPHNNGALGPSLCKR